MKTTLVLPPFSHERRNLGVVWWRSWELQGSHSQDSWFPTYPGWASLPQQPLIPAELWWNGHQVAPAALLRANRRQPLPISPQTFPPLPYPKTTSSSQLHPSSGPSWGGRPWTRIKKQVEVGRSLVGWTGCGCEGPGKSRWRSGDRELGVRTGRGVSF